MSKSLGNYVGITEPPGVMFGKLMSISDELMWPYYELLTDFAQPVIERLREEVRTGVLHPMAAKTQLAHVIVAGFHGEAAAKKAAEEFQRVFRERQTPEGIPEFRIVWSPDAGAFLHERRGEIIYSTSPFPVSPGGTEKWVKLLVLLQQIASVAEAERLVKQGAIEINGSILRDPTSKVTLAEKSVYTVRVGKRKFFRLVIG